VSRQVPIHPDDEDRVAALMSRELDAVAAENAIRPSAGFADRVMAAVAGEPLPQPVRAFGVAIVGGRLRAAIASVGDAWRVIGGGSTPIFVRAQALALVLVVTMASLAVAGGATVGAIDLLNANQPATPPPTAPVPTKPVASPIPSPSPNSTPDASPDASSAPQASQAPQPTPTEAPPATERPRTATPRPTSTDDHGGGSGGGDDGGGGGSGGGNQTPTPTPTETDDHGGSDG
jgi:hypothetical protein